MCFVLPLPEGVFVPCCISRVAIPSAMLQLLSYPVLEIGSEHVQRLLQLLNGHNLLPFCFSGVVALPSRCHNGDFRGNRLPLTCSKGRCLPLTGASGHEACQILHFPGIIVCLLHSLAAGDLWSCHAPWLSCSTDCHIAFSLGWQFFLRSVRC